MHAKSNSRSPNDRFPLYPMQAAYYVGDSSDLVLSTTARFYREVEIDAFPLKSLEDAWNAVIDRHEMLRAVICDDGNQTIVQDVIRYKIAFHDFRDVSPSNLDEKYQGICGDLMSRTLTLNKWPQFCLEASLEGSKMRLHFRFNLWVVDAVSVQIILSDLLALCSGANANFPPLNNSFQAYVAHSKLTTDTTSGTKSKSYWEKRSSNLPTGPELPLLSTADEIASPEFIHLTSSLPADAWAFFTENAKRNRLTPTVAVLACYAMALARWSKSRHFCITLLLSKRPFSSYDVENIVGNFGTTILLEIDCRTNPGFVDLARAIQKQLWSDVKYLDVSGIEVSRQVNRHRDTPMALVAPVTFTSLMSKGELPENVETMLQKCKTTRSCLAVPQVYLDHQIFEETQGHLTINWDYVRGLYPVNMIEGMFEAYLCKLQTLSHNSDAWLASALLELPSWQKHLIQEYNSTEVNFEISRLETPVVRTIAERPHDLALINGQLRLTYEELGRLVEALQVSILKSGLPAGSIISVHLLKGWRQVVAVLAILKTGNVYVPIDPELPVIRRRQLIERSRSSLIITQEGCDLDLDKGVNIINIDDPCDVPSSAPIPYVAESISDTAYVIFTSGSTGVPKGVAIDHKGAVNTILDVNRRLDISNADRILALSSLSFDLSVFDIFGILSAGGTVVIPTQSEQQDPASWLQLIHAHKITVWNSVPALFQLMVDYSRENANSLPSLKNVMLSGDWIPRNLPTSARQVARNARIFSLGGATEASIWSVIYEIGDLDDSWKTIPYGRPLANQTLHVFDEDFSQSPAWKAGELYIGGAGLAQEYLNDPERTQERFLLHPETKQRLYRTGDMARLRPDGYMEFLGREDHQIKIRGFRIELGEIEAAVLRLPSVSSVVVKVVGKSDATRKLVAFITTSRSELVSDVDIKLHLQQELPRYMVVDSVVFVDEIPLTKNGKIDHKALEYSYESQRREVDIKGEAELDNVSADILESVRDLWQQVLALSLTSYEESFFALGGTSFQALQLISKIRKRFGIKLNLSSLSSTVSVREMATLISSSAKVADDNPLISLNVPSYPATEAKLFCVHPVGGGAHCYMPLTRYLSKSATIFGLQSPLGFLQDAAPCSIEKLAESYVDIMLRQAPEGPYALVGWSMGASVAVEIARILKSAGKQVSFVGLIDPYRARPDASRAQPAQDSLIEFCHDLAGIAGKESDLDQQKMQLKCSSAGDATIFESAMNHLVDLGVLPKDPPIDELRNVFEVFKINSISLLEYEPKHFDFEIDVFHAEASYPIAESQLEKWIFDNKNCRSRWVKADHFSIMQHPFIEAIADQINKRLYE